MTIEESCTSQTSVNSLEDNDPIRGVRYLYPSRMSLRDHSLERNQKYDTVLNIEDKEVNQSNADYRRFEQQQQQQDQPEQNECDDVKDDSDQDNSDDE